MMKVKEKILKLHNILAFPEVKASGIKQFISFDLWFFFEPNHNYTDQSILTFKSTNC